MDFKQAKINWLDIIKSGILYTSVEWRKLAVEDSSRSLEGQHWRITSPLYARYRIITLEWYIDRLDWNELTNVNHLEKLFSLQGSFLSLEEKVLYIKDNFDNERTLNVKIKDPIEFLEWDENLKWSHRKWRVVLESTKSPIYKSINENLTTWIEGNYWWFKLWYKLGVKLNYSSNKITVIAWSSESNARFEINVLSNINAPLKILNITNNTFFWLDINANTWDIIIIDWDNYTVTKNWINIIWSRLSGSQWQKVINTTNFVISDIDWNLNWNDLSIKIYYRNNLL